MSYLLDTMVFSEIARPHPNHGLRTWLDSQARAHLFIGAPTIGEIVAGICALPPSRKRTALEASLADLTARFGTQILSLDVTAARAWGSALGASRRVGRTLPLIDTQLAAIAHTNSLALVTRNVRDFEAAGFAGLAIVNPWT